MSELAGQKSVLIKVSTTINHGHTKEEYSFSATGEIYEKQEATYIKYTEQNEVGDVSTILKVKHDDEIQMMRSGSVKMRQVFRRQNTTAGFYESPYGKLLMETTTEKIRIVPGHISITYKMALQQQVPADYTLQIQYQEGSDE
ncbi:DUF1934 domain-containing protein [Bacillus sp. HMF5848]|uniref:DUF1934 domain-containing protein n=1 Tax=Bacillus sp. HMF5848 TaxID=2495421 RepID=UPI000F7A95C0|nr:DUF1934 domain-containing protein [Bacillus sp. HMF5848]RSK28987.1 DUF1934 domain-containing protein [Bacillus sp. HMF5848]